MLAAAHLGWPLQDVTTVSLVGRPLAALNAQLHPGARLFVLSSDAGTPAAIAATDSLRTIDGRRRISARPIADRRRCLQTPQQIAGCRAAGDGGAAGANRVGNHDRRLAAL